MLLAKTDKARAAIADRSPGLSAQERHILIVSNGQRSLDDIASMLGPATMAAIERLLREGYLDATAAPGSSHGAAPMGAREAPTPPATPRTGPRRSLAAAKLYMLDMLQLQRSAKAASLTAAIQSSSDEDEVLAHLIDSLRHLRDVATATYYARVALRLNEVLPEAFVPRVVAALGPARTSSSAA